MRRPVVQHQLGALVQVQLGSWTQRYPARTRTRGDTSRARAVHSHRLPAGGNDMTRDETARLVEWMVQTWPAGVRGRVWTETLGGLDYAPALAAYRRARDTVTNLTVAHFLDLYRSCDWRPEGIPKPADTGPVVDLADHIAQLHALCLSHDHDIAVTAEHELRAWRRLGKVAG